MQSTLSMPGAVSRHKAAAASVEGSSAPWYLYVPLIFFAVRGLFSFQSGGIAEGGFMPGTIQVRDPGILGSVILPGLAYGTVLLLIMSRWRDVLAKAKEFKIFIVICFLAIASFAWSQDPAHSALFGVCFLFDTLFAFYLVTRYTTDELMQIAERLMLVLCVVSILMIALFPKYGLSQLDVRNPNAWAGIFSSRSNASRLYQYLISAAIVLWLRYRTTSRTLVILFGLVMLFQAHTVAPILMVFLFGSLIVVQRIFRRLAPRTSLGFAGAFFLFLLLGGTILATNWTTILEALGRDPTLTGRTDIWAILVYSVRKRPLLGYGYYAFWQGLNGESGVAIQRLNWTFSYAHNGYLEVILQLGAVGLSLFFVTLIQGLRNAWKCFLLDRTGQYVWYVAIILFVAIQNMEDCTVLYPKDLLSIFYVVACCGLASGARLLQSKQQHAEVARV